MKLLDVIGVLALGSVLLSSACGAAEGIREATPQQLQAWLRQYPDADADGDGQLTIDEARAYQRQMERGRSPRRSFDFRHEYTFATMSDGVRIALAIGYPRDYDPDADCKWPAIFRTSGYPDAVLPASPAEYGERYVTVQASLRGSGASGGALAPFEPRTWQDGYEIIEDWIVQQPWSNGSVGIHGYSWPGLMGFLTASTRPPSLKAICVGGLIDDFYRGIARLGGVPNYGFPVDWLNNFYRPEGAFGSDLAARLARGVDEAAFAKIVASRPRRDLAADLLWLGLHQPLDDPRWRVASLGTHAARIQAPILISHAWQDEQTGPDGWRLWQRVPESVPKRLLLTNGNHGVVPHARSEAADWFGHWLLGQPHPQAVDPERRVVCYFETRDPATGSAPPLTARDFPLPQTNWTRYYLRSGGRLSTSAATAEESPSRYRVEHRGPDGEAGRAAYLLEFSEPTAICGPSMLTLWATLTTLDTDFYVLLADRAPDGRLYGLQRGLLRASHRAVDEQHSDFVSHAEQRLLVRPHHPHDRVEPVAPGEPCEFQIEVHAVGHVFRPGHQLALVITRPPAGDPIGITSSGEPSYRYDSHPPPGTVTILHDPHHRSNLLLPVMDELPPLPADPVDLDEQAGIQLAR